MIYPYMLWAFTPKLKGRDGSVVPIKIAGGTMREVKSRQKSFMRDYPDAVTSIYASGVAPVGLRAQCKATHGGI